MNIENVIHNENLTLKPLPPKILYCSVCKTDFISYLKSNGWGAGRRTSRTALEL